MNKKNIMIYFLTLAILTVVLTSSVNAQDTTTNSIKPDLGESFTIDEITETSTNLKKYKETHGKLPETVEIAGKEITMPEYMKISSKTIINVNKNNKSNIGYSKVKNPTKPLNTKIGKINKANYIDVNNRLYNFIDNHQTAPNYVSVGSSKIGYEATIFMNSKILDYYKEKNALPNYVTDSTSTNNNPPSTTSGEDGRLKVIGKADYGYVKKGTFGNKNSKNTIVLIIGVHPLENGIHKSLYKNLIANENKLNKRIVLYNVTVTKNPLDYTEGRMNGQLLARSFIVPDVASEKPIMVLDNHENRYKQSSYKHPRFLYPISKDSLTISYANKIIKNMPSTLPIYYPPNPTSPSYVTVPIAKKGIPTIIYETYLSDSTSRKMKDSKDLLLTLNHIPNKHQEETIVEYDTVITSNPSSGNYYNPVTVTLNSTAGSEIHYTLDGSNPSTKSSKFTSDLNIETSKILKFVAFIDGKQVSQIYTNKYNIYQLKNITITEKIKDKKVKKTYIKKVKYYKKVRKFYKKRGKKIYYYKKVAAYKKKKVTEYKWTYKNKYSTKETWVLT